MNIALRKPMTLADFLIWEREQELRYEFDGSAAVAVTGDTVEHSVIGTNLVRALEDRLRGKPCRAFRGDLKIIAAGRVRYPDALVSCSPVPPRTDIIPHPVVVFEIQSDSTGHIDRVTKNIEYRATPSIQHYVMPEQISMAATVFSREGQNWVGHLLTGDTTLALPAIGVELPLAALYEGVTLPQQDG